MCAVLSALDFDRLKFARHLPPAIVYSYLEVKMIGVLTAIQIGMAAIGVINKGIAAYRAIATKGENADTFEKIGAALDVVKSGIGVLEQVQSKLMQAKAESRDITADELSALKTANDELTARVLGKLDLAAKEPS